MTTPRDPDDADVALRVAAQSLRRHSHEQGLQVARDVLARVLAEPRRSFPMRSRGHRSRVHVSERVVVTAVREHVTGSVASIAVDDVICDVDLDETLAGVLVVVVGRYGDPLTTATQAVVAATHQALDAVLGPRAEEPEVSVVHAHVSDITAGDPRRTHPLDE